MFSIVDSYEVKLDNYNFSIYELIDANTGKKLGGAKWQ